ncbi:hypothetical protein CJ030_MR7G013491 [Morella rubra]|uniref:Uncharacterized protein n=1 Tax=Morella rubra TaxID=262757 RepID=A0A6A1V238_9ROSI|nr:hypothetical protein CJ030_MR7G013491 [Morella rubra]
MARKCYAREEGRTFVPTSMLEYAIEVEAAIFKFFITFLDNAYVTEVGEVSEFRTTFFAIHAVFPGRYVVAFNI